MNASIRITLGVLGALALLNGCAHRNEIKADAATPAPVAAQPAQDSTGPATNVTAHYIVKKGDCLWSIAAKPSVLGDAFHWPLLYKQNRDEIQDPDLIQPHEDLSYQRHYDDGELSQALAQASAWPAYKTPIKIAQDQKY